MSSIEGIPEGWELVRVGKPIINVDCVVTEDGMPVLIDWVTDRRNWLIIRKIEKPKTYRAFENMEEAEPWFDEALRWKDGSKAIFRVSAMGNTHVVIGFNQYTYQEAFSKFVNQHGTPFGVEVTS